MPPSRPVIVAGVGNGWAGRFLRRFAHIRRTLVGRSPPYRNRAGDSDYTAACRDSKYKRPFAPLNCPVDLPISFFSGIAHVAFRIGVRQDQIVIQA